jgi:outer membrane protein assembly factor BamB
VLYGDPAFRPFAACAPRGLGLKAVKGRVDMTVDEEFVFESFDQFTGRKWRLPLVLDVGGVKSVTAAGDLKVVETRWLVEDGRRLHVAAYSDDKELKRGTKVRFTITFGGADVPSVDTPRENRDVSKPLWTLDTKSPSYGSGALGDIDGDGKLEVVFGTYYNDEHLYAVNVEDGSLLWKMKSDGGPFDASVALVDLDGDRKLEILAGDSSTGKLFCLDGAGREKWSIKLPNSTDSPPAVADLDGDGVLEIVVGTMWRRGGKGDVTVYRSDTREVVWQRQVAGCVQSEPCLIDLNGDGALDVIVTSWRGDNAVHAFSGKDGAALWTFETMDDGDTAKTHLGLYHGVSAGVLRKGGELRIAFGTCSSSRGTVYVLDAKGKLVWKKMLREYLFAPTTMADLNGDGTREVIAIGSRTHVFSADGESLWTADVGGARGAAVVDIDGDGDPDVVLGSRGRKAVALDGPTGKQIWSYDATCGTHAYEGLDSAPLIADFDGDGVLDLFMVAGKGTSDESRPENYGRAFAVPLGRGKGTWETFRGNLTRTGAR